MTVIDKNAMLNYVRWIGFDPNKVSGLHVDGVRTVATLKSQETDVDAVIAFLESQGIDTTDLVSVDLWNNKLTVTRHSQDKYGDLEFSIDVNVPKVHFKKVSDDYDIG